MWIVFAGITGFLLDCIIGDPSWLPHPIRYIGLCISRFERLFRRLCPKTPAGERTAGVLMAVTLLAVTLLCSGLVLWCAMLINFWLCYSVASIMCWQVLAAKCLKTEAMKVQRELEKGDIPSSRAQIAMLVGRDTENLNEKQITKAAVETVAENTSDGVVAPLFWVMIGGPIAGMLYKAVNTMDSMVGYKNERYLHFGRFAAKLDDAVNFAAARITALTMIAAAFILRFDGKSAYRVWSRDYAKHASPNSAHPESACAGALNIRLAGPSSYFGKVLEKPFIGDDKRPIEPRDIKRSCRIMYGASVISLILFAALRLAITFLWW